MSSLNGVQLNSTGLDMRTQFMDQGINNLPNPESGMANSLPNNPLYNLYKLYSKANKLITFQDIIKTITLFKPV